MSSESDSSRLGGARRLRDACGRFGTGVALVTCSGEPPCAVTVNSFVSLSLQPPLVAFSLIRDARCLSQLRDANALAVSVLRHDQRLVAANFARPSTAVWAGMPLFRSTAGHLLVREALAAFECAPEQHLTIGDHVVFLLRVVDAHLARPAAPLMFFGGGYGSFLPDERNADTLFGDAGLAMGWG